MGKLQGMSVIKHGKRGYGNKVFVVNCVSGFHILSSADVRE